MRSARPEEDDDHANDDILDQKYRAARQALGELDAALGQSITAGAAGGTRAPAPRAAQMAQAHSGPTLARDLSGAERGASVTGRGVHGGTVAPGQVIPNSTTLAAVIRDVLMGLDRGAPRGDVLVASARWADRYPDDRRLSRPDDAIANSQAVEKICGPQALTASGGICLPVNVDYSVPTWATTDRPVRDGLPPFQADRGGLRFVSPPRLGSGLAAVDRVGPGVGDRTVDGSDRCQPRGRHQTRVPSALRFGAVDLRRRSADTVAVRQHAVPGSRQNRYAANTDVAMAAATHKQELNLLTLMYTSTKQVADRGRVPGRGPRHPGDARPAHRAVQVQPPGARHPVVPGRCSRRGPRVSSERIFSRELAHDNAGPGASVLRRSPTRKSRTTSRPAT